MNIVMTSCTISFSVTCSLQIVVTFGNFSIYSIVTRHKWWNIVAQTQNRQRTKARLAMACSSKHFTTSKLDLDNDFWGKYWLYRGVLSIRELCPLSNYYLLKGANVEYVQHCFTVLFKLYIDRQECKPIFSFSWFI